MIGDSCIMSEKVKGVLNQFDANHFHWHIKQLYRQRFSDEYNKISALKKRINGYTERS